MGRDTESVRLASSSTRVLLSLYLRERKTTGKSQRDRSRISLIDRVAQASRTMNNIVTHGDG
jgi:hypothetical protein